jgi:hypothetical protein
VSVESGKYLWFDLPVPPPSHGRPAGAPQSAAFGPTSVASFPLAM